MIYLSGVVTPGLPAMLTPRMRQQPPPGELWAADNGRYASPHEYTDAGYLAWLARMPVSSCLFATAPDVVRDAVATLELSAPLYRQSPQLGYVPALVAQDGLEELEVPWADIGCLFIGGSDAWKEGEAAYALAREARSRGLWVHHGRVNSRRRWEIARAMGCHSVDGTLLRFGPDVNRHRIDGWLASLAHPMLWGDS